MVNAQQVQGQWNKIRGRVKEKWGQLTDDDLVMAGGGVDQLIGRIQKKTGEGREAIEKFLSELTSSGAAGLSNAAESAREYAQRAGSYVQGAGDRLREGYGRMADGAQEGYERAEDMVRHNPAESVAAAFGLGIVVGLLVGLALRSR